VNRAGKPTQNGKIESFNASFATNFLRLMADLATLPRKEKALGFRLRAFILWVTQSLVGSTGIEPVTPAV
jgi:transposase InsO family protein